MSRVINTNNPGKIRERNRRTIAELLRRLSKKQSIDQEALDMLATIVFELTEIWAGVETTTQAWEKRGYWMKADRFIRDWEWTREVAANLDDILRHEAWDLIPEIIAECYPHFTDIKIKTMTRKPDTWRGAYNRLLNEEPLPLPY